MFESFPWSPPSVWEEYRLIQKLGQGGMGSVYLAEDTMLGRLVAIKFIVSSIDLQPEARERLFIEARAAARIQHPNVVSFYRVGELDHHPYIVSEFVRGQDLNDARKPIEWQRVLELAIGLSRGLAAAHRRGVLHRDIKPANAIIAEDCTVKLLDFGLAKLVDTTTASFSCVPQAIRKLAGDEETAPGQTQSFDGNRLTNEGTIVGTAAYIPYEIWRGEPASRRSDVYSMGALLYELCTGRPPFDDSDIHTLLRAITDREATPLGRTVPGINPKFAAIIERCLRRDPQERFASADELLDAFEQLTAVARGGDIPEGNPYRGLRPFEAEHRALFFGRRGEALAVVERLRSESFVLVAGDSGVGKSSLCRAGVLPMVQDGALQDGREWVACRLVPGKRPLLAIQAALADVLKDDTVDVTEDRLMEEPTEVGRQVRLTQGKSRGTVLFIDQFEEILTLSDPTEARAACELLARLSSGLPGVRLLATIRSDFLGRIADLPGIGSDVGRALYFLRSLGPERIREVIVGPAHATGVRFESGEMVNEIVDSTARAEGGLPLLQFALAELWEARDLQTQVIPVQALSSLGGVAGALAKHADQVVRDLLPAQRTAARRILTGLVSADRTRARCSDHELVAGDPVGQATLDALVRGRLLVARESEGSTVYEVAHEALLSGWGTLRKWLGEQAEHREVLERLSLAAAEWVRLGKTRDSLWNARQLAEAAGIADSETGPREIEFLAASRRASQRQKLVARGTAAAVLLLVGLGIGGTQFVAHRAREKQVSRHVQMARRILQRSTRQARLANRLRAEALHLFDTNRTTEAEAIWSRTLQAVQKLQSGYEDASRVLEKALALDPTEGQPKRLLAGVLYRMALLAEREGKADQVPGLIGRIELYDQKGQYLRRWNAPATIRFLSSPSGATVSVRRYETQSNGSRVLGGPRRLGRSLLTALELAPGSYRFELALEGREPVLYPVVLHRGEKRTIHVVLPPDSAVPAGFVYVSAGRFTVGSSVNEDLRKGFLDTVPAHEVDSGPYLIARTETTFGDWIVYLNALDPQERRVRTPKVGSGGFQGALELAQVDGTWQLTFQPGSVAHVAREGEMLPYPTRARRASQDWQRFPVTGIRLEDARAYVGWLRRTGRVLGARLCTEREWERAARGADDREYPHGNRLGAADANFDLTYGKDTDAMGSDEVGQYPVSRSPFGLDDMAGNAGEWLMSAADEPVVRGGAAGFDAMSARSTNREVVGPEMQDMMLGLRVCADVVP